ncbi:hypothetical protein SARC_17367 [Sphaeroforma arctica JP610]|uniref:Uncharacterized protein n=1 Tax=Sphaeroforma arctica JP610 TaxID=667725 RepID=A0A0L0F077_9EUKA|nr:hypothetical protein SARC_17367 [Sphaeroforma arctica JP610]KNC70110.1 hypothetical protein SARC_17367 [Sphaeroforma arctica JP610]|eukprot:XP_014144012.1 hypothetical protein SARC_17367 [Sphaeroforma arctica JP610]
MQWASLSLRLDESERVGTDLKIEQHDELQAIVSAACDVLSRLWQQAGRYFVEGSAKAFTNAINANGMGKQGTPTHVMYSPCVRNGLLF